MPTMVNLAQVKGLGPCSESRSGLYSLLPPHRSGGLTSVGFVLPEVGCPISVASRFFSKCSLPSLLKEILLKCLSSFKPHELVFTLGQMSLLWPITEFPHSPGQHGKSAFVLVSLTSLTGVGARIMSFCSFMSLVLYFPVGTLRRKTSGDYK